MDLNLGKGLILKINPEDIGFKLHFTVSPAHAAICGHVLFKGLENILKDVHASIKREDYAEGDEGTAQWRKDSLDASAAKWEAMTKGELRFKAAGPRVPMHNPLMTELLREARVFVYGKAAGKGRDEYIAKLRAFLSLPERDSTQQTAAQGDEKDVLQAAIAYRITKADRIEAAQAVVAARGPVNDEEVC